MEGNAYPPKMITTSHVPPRQPRVYLAGPDVFFPDCVEIFKMLKALCSQLGLVGVAPTDAPVPQGPSQSAAADGDARAQAIYEGNIALIRDVDGVIANLQAFRGLEPDSGTVFEVGFAIALGKPVVGYGVGAGTYADRVAASLDCVTDEGGRVKERASGVTVEGLGQRLNLMLSRSIRLEADARMAMETMARQWVRHR
jgi:nucleoside 2-deoxyribosyltransferase